MIKVRAMRMDDVDAVSTIRVRGWQATYAGIVPRSYLDAMSVEEDAFLRRTWLATAGNRVENLVATEDGVVTGWAALGPRAGEPREPGGGVACELYALYVRPDRIGTGTGRRLMSAVRSRAAELGHLRLEFWVLADNARARRFYARAGFSPDGAEQVEEYDGVPLRDLRYAGDTSAPA
ncbi:GNAT family N-acetyltransferase [Streptomyces sp. PA03-6a]|nr:GNAT family N-acetyltransferase [Streptomyces sp. PA03-6a]